MGLNEAHRPTGEPKLLIHLIESHRSLASLRTTIINDVISHGLMPVAELERTGRLYVCSSDTGSYSHSFVHGRIIPAHSGFGRPKWFSKRISSGLYETGFSVLPVLMERQGELEYVPHLRLNPHHLTETDQRILERRVASSLIVIAERQQRGAIDGGVYPKSFIALIFPEKIWDDYHANMQRETDLIIKVVRETVIRDVFEAFSLRVPDYESVLMSLLKKLKQPVWIHGVRLPTEEDLARRAMSTLPRGD